MKQKLFLIICIILPTFFNTPAASAQDSLRAQEFVARESRIFHLYAFDSNLRPWASKLLAWGKLSYGMYNDTTSVLWLASCLDGQINLTIDTILTQEQKEKIEKLNFLDDPWEIWQPAKTHRVRLIFTLKEIFSGKNKLANSQQIIKNIQEKFDQLHYIGKLMFINNIKVVQYLNK